MGVNPKIRGNPPKWMVKIMENPMNKWDDFGGPGKHPYFWFNTHMFPQTGLQHSLRQIFQQGECSFPGISFEGFQGRVVVNDVGLQTKQTAKECFKRKLMHEFCDSHTLHHKIEMLGNFQLVSYKVFRIQAKEGARTFVKCSLFQGTGIALSKQRMDFSEVG